MKTIEERANEFSKQFCGENCIFVCSDWKDQNGVCRRLKSQAALYKSIATEQRAIDIEKALEWLKAYDITFTQTPSMLEDFKRAMEE